MAESSDTIRLKDLFRKFITYDFYLNHIAERPPPNYSGTIIRKALNYLDINKSLILTEIKVILEESF
ncbi:hypothetical protein LCGC14_0175300 [marine sediment metagenome]|uniref:Uncharacterized protein n=1 Tax=marine sediment metagenome TaxID=412755 RepID=A0A0F9X9J7_9ZZZZ